MTHLPKMGFYLATPDLDTSAEATGAVTRRALELGVDFLYFERAWDQMEREPGVYTFPALDARDLHAAGLQAIHGFHSPVNMHHVWAVPSDLRDVTFDDPGYIERFARMATAYLKHVGVSDDETYLTVANESTMYLEKHPEAEQPLTDFLSAVGEAIREQLPGVRIGTTLPLGTGDPDPLRPYADLFRGFVDWLGFNYYAFGDARLPGFRAYQPGTGHLASVFDAMEELAQGVPILVTEIGMPTADLLGGSHELQARYMEELLDELTRRPSIVSVKWFWLQDLTPDANVELCKRIWGDVGSGHDPRFQAYIGTLGIITSDGDPKPAEEVWRAVMGAPARA